VHLLDHADGTSQTEKKRQVAGTETRKARDLLGKALGGKKVSFGQAEVGTSEYDMTKKLLYVSTQLHFTCTCTRLN